MKLIIGLLLVLNLFANDTITMYKLYQNQEYEKACDIGLKIFYKNKQDENFLSLYAFSCLQSDNINRLALPIANLKYTRESRANASYFSVILMQKKLLYHALIDGYDLKSLNLPTTDYILSKVFDAYAKLENTEKKPYYIFKDENDKKRVYKLYLIQDKKVKKIVIEEFYDTIAIKRHVYW